jgi:hypothetical protein
MAKRIVSIINQTPTGTADAATALANGTYPFAVQGGSSTQRIAILEVYLGGLAGASSPMPMLLSRDSTIGVTGGSFANNGQDNPVDPATAALAAVPLVNNAFTTAPQRSTTGHLHSFAFNAFGGIVLWRPADPSQAPSILGNTASNGEFSLSMFNAGTAGALSAHLVYEPL